MIPILTYHSLHAPGWSYGENDHIALENDLRVIRRLKLRIVPLAVIANALKEQRIVELASRGVLGISFDDGADFDYYDFVHPDFGHLKSMARILREQASDLGQDGGQANATSFVIVSPQARVELDRTCIAGRSQWRDVWWYEAAQSGVLTVANHSWDHLHGSLQEVAHSRDSRNSFMVVDNVDDADAQIKTAHQYLQSMLGRYANGLFAYPYGQAPRYLIESYFPAHDFVQAAFTTGGAAVTAQTNVLEIPRYVCGEHWHSPEELEAILA